MIKKMCDDESGVPLLIVFLVGIVCGFLIWGMSPPEVELLLDKPFVSILPKQIVNETTDFINDFHVDCDFGLVCYGGSGGTFACYSDEKFLKLYCEEE